MSDYPHRDEEIQDFADDVTVKAKANLKNRGKNSSGRLNKSLATKVVETSAGPDINFYMEDYGQGIDAGSSGKNKSRSRGKSLFNVRRAGQPPVSDIRKWIAQKPVTQSGNKIPIRSLAYVIARKIGNDGYRGSHFFTDAFESEFKPFGDDLAKAIGEDVEDIIEDSLDKIPNTIGN